MQVFLQVVESGNFTRAAEALGLPRSTVSSTVQALEDRLGAQLFQRSTRVVRPTQDGLRLAGRARELVDAMAETEALFRQRPEQIRGALRIDMPGRLASRLLIPHLHEFRDRHPGITLDLSATDRLIDLVSEGVDAVIRLAVLEDSDLVCRRLGEVTMVTVASPGYLARSGVPQGPGDLGGHLLVNFAQTMPAPVAEWDGRARGRPITVAMRSALCVDSAETYASAALHGHGLVQVPLHGVADDIAQGRLVEVLADWRPAPLPLSILYARRRHLPPRLRVFMDWLAGLLRREGYLA